MKNQEDIRLYVRKKIKRGYPEGELRNDLLQQGYSDEEIQRFIYDPEINVKKKSKRITDSPLWYAISVGFLILGLTLFLGPSIWLREFNLLFLILGLIGIIAKYILRNIEEQKKK